MFIAHYSQYPRYGNDLNAQKDEWIKMTSHTHTHTHMHTHAHTMEYYSAIEKNKITPFAAAWIQLEILILSEVSQKEKDKYMLSLICGI